MIDPRVLRTYLAVCRERSITGAARRLNISQPSVSVAIAQLEQDLGTCLFTRSRLGIQLTPAGDVLLRRAETVESLLRDTQEEIALTIQGAQGPLRIGGTPGALVSLVPDAVARLERTGRFTLHILERPDSQLIAMLRRGDIEVAICTTGLDTPLDDIEERSIARDPFSLIVGPAHAGLGPTVSLRDVAGLGWVLPEAVGAFHRQIEALFLAAEVRTPSDVVRSDSLPTSKAIVQQGARVTVLPRGVVAGELAMGVLRAIPLEGVDFNRSIGIRTVAGRPLSVLAKRFVEAVTHGS